jgi:hypothetical protein
MLWHGRDSAAGSVRNPAPVAAFHQLGYVCKVHTERAELGWEVPRIAAGGGIHPAGAPRTQTSLMHNTFLSLFSINQHQHASSLSSLLSFSSSPFLTPSSFLCCLFLRTGIVLLLDFAYRGDRGRPTKQEPTFLLFYFLGSFRIKVGSLKLATITNKFN